jgi:hypothetical protein
MFHCAKETGIGVPARPRSKKEEKELGKLTEMSKPVKRSVNILTPISD